MTRVVCRLHNRQTSARLITTLTVDGHLHVKQLWTKYPLREAVVASLLMHRPIHVPAVRTTAEVKDQCYYIMVWLKVVKFQISKHVGSLALYLSVNTE